MDLYIPSIKKYWFHYLLLIPIILGVFFRLYKFGQIPLSLNRDEAALGYNAYSLAFYGTDEWGNSTPITFKSFGDYKLPGYIYTLAIFARLFSINASIIRLPSLIAGIGIILLSYKLASLIFRSKLSGLVTAAIISLSPWAIFYSRMAFEANLGLFLMLLSIYLLIKPLNFLNLILATITYTLAIFTYNAPLILFPFLLLFILIYTKKPLNLIPLAIGALVGFLILIPVNLQKSSITIFSDPTLNTIQREQYIKAITLPQKLLTHRYTFYTQKIFNNFLASFSPSFLSLKGGANPWHSVSGYGHISITIYLLLAITLAYYLTHLPILQKYLSVWLLFLSGLIPAIITTDAPHATRSLLFLFGLSLFVIPLLIKKRWFIAVSLSLLIIESVIYGYFYTLRMSQLSTKSWPYQLTDTALALVNNPAAPPLNFINSQQDPQSDQLYIYLLLDTLTPPTYYQQTLTKNPSDSAGMIRVASFSRFYLNYPFKETPENTLTITPNNQGIYELKP